MDALPDGPSARQLITPGRAEKPRQALDGIPQLAIQRVNPYGKCRVFHQIRSCLFDPSALTSVDFPGRREVSWRRTLSFWLMERGIVLTRTRTRMARPITRTSISCS